MAVYLLYYFIRSTTRHANETTRVPTPMSLEYTASSRPSTEINQSPSPSIAPSSVTATAAQQTADAKHPPCEIDLNEPPPGPRQICSPAGGDESKPRSPA